jgi:signal peptidase I
MNGSPRSAAARIGLTLLNLWVPGLGLLRVGPLRTALLFLLLPPATLLLFLAWSAIRETFGFGEWAALMSVLLIAQFGAWIGSMVVTWRRSRVREETRPPWSRWFAIVAAAIAFPLAVLLVTDVIRANVHNFYIPSEAMMPTLARNDRLVAAMHGPGALRRGDIILFRMPGGTTYIKRVAALPGDRIAMSEGIVVLNGRPVPQRFLREETTGDSSESMTVRRLAERFPGEAQEHQIYDSGPSDVDDMPERIVPAGFVFVLGDHRDRSADSRVPRAAMGVELLPIGDIAGHPQFQTWPRSKMGLRLDGTPRD